MKRSIVCGSNLLLVMAIGACISEPDGLEEGAGDESFDLAEQLAPPRAVATAQSLVGDTLKLAPTYTERALSPHGGGGGAYNGHVTPPAVIYGVRVRSGIYVDAIAFAWYQPRQSTNYFQAGDLWGGTRLFGGGGGVDNGWWYCPAGQGVIGLRGNSGSLVDRISVICSNVNYPNPYSSLNAYSPLWGGGGGSWFGEDRCAAGRLVDSFNVRSGAYVDNLQAICIDAH